MKVAQQITCQSSQTCTRDPFARTTMCQQETMTHHPHAVADHGRRQHLTTADLRDLIRQIFPRHHLGSRVVNKRTVLFKTMSGICGRALNATSPREAQRHGTLWTIKQWKRLAHYMVYVRCAAFFDTLSREFLMLIPVGRLEDIRLALRRREQRETKEKKSNVANFLEAQRVRGNALPRGNRGTPWEKAPNDCDHPPNAVQKGGNAVMYYERCVMCGNRWQRIPLTMEARDPETKLNNRTVLASTGKRPVEIERPFLSARTREHDDAGHVATEPLLGMLDVQCHLRTQPGRVRCSTCRLGERRGCRREHGSHGCCSANPGIIVVGIPRTASKSHFKFCMTLCIWQHERFALYIMILTDSEEQFSALETLHLSEGSAWLGRDLRQAETGARLNLP